MTAEDTQDAQNEAQDPVGDSDTAEDTQFSSGDTQPRPVDLIFDANHKVARSLSKAGLGERIEYAVSMVAMPDPQGNVMPVLMIVVAIPSLLIGQKMTTSVLIQSLSMEQEETDRLMLDVLSQLRESRSQQARSATDQAPGLVGLPRISN